MYQPSNKLLLMNVVLVTPTNQIEGEIDKIIKLFEDGLQTLHLRKPKLSKRKVEDYLKSIPRIFHNRIIIHGHYELACKYKLKGVNFKREHRENSFANRWMKFILRLKAPNLIFTTTYKSIESLQEKGLNFDYVILNPVFTAKAHYDENEESGLNVLKKAIENSHQKVIAMGGVNEENIKVVSQVGFSGVAFSEELLQTDSPSLKIISNKAA